MSYWGNCIIAQIRNSYLSLVCPIFPIIRLDSDIMICRPIANGSGTVGINVIFLEWGVVYAKGYILAGMHLYHYSMYLCLVKYKNYCALS